MQSFLFFVLLGLPGTIGGIAVQESQQADIVKELKAYYADNKPPSFEGALKKLAKPATPEREAAALYLRMLLAQALKDEKLGTAPWRATPYWGSSGENPARNLRTTIADQLAAANALPGAVPVLRWFFDDEILPALQISAATALGKLKSDDATLLRTELATLPHSNLIVAVAALKQIAAEKGKLPPDKLRVLSYHHRASMREAARKLNEQQGGPDPGPFDPVLAMRGPTVAKLMKDIGVMLIEPLPAGAPLPALSVNVETEVVRVEKIRKEGAKNFEFSSLGPLTGQFEGRGASLYEIVLGHRLYAAGKLDLAARVLLPALETLHRDDDLVSIARRELGRYYGYQMLVAFAGDRDYDRAMKSARILVKHFPETLFHDDAGRMLVELPKRRDDFGKLKLPSPDEWARLKEKLTRIEQIDFLCQRLRLLNVWTRGEQSARPVRDLSDNATWSHEIEIKGDVINPLDELLGPLNWFGAKEDRPGMHLTVKDVPHLAKHLRDDWLMLCIHYWRDFHPSRTIPTTRHEVASIINEVAKKDICNLKGWDRLAPAEIDRQIERIKRWAQENADKTALQLEWEVLDAMLASGKEWYSIRDRVESLLQQKQTKAYDVMKKMLESEKTDGWSKSQILQMYIEHGLGRAKDLAPKYLENKDESLRFNAALIVFKTGEKLKARVILGDALASDRVVRYEQAVEALLKDGFPESRKQVERLFVNPTLRHPRGGATDMMRSTIFGQCLQAGMKDPYRFYLPLLDINKSRLSTFDKQGKEVGYSQFDSTIAEMFAKEIVEYFAMNDPAVQEIARKFPKVAEQIPHLKKWLQAKLDAPKTDPAGFLPGVRRILFLGDSITYDGRYAAYLETQWRLHLKDRPLEVINCGLPSETVSGLSEDGHAGGKFARPDLHERLTRVLKKTRPDLVFACYGMNDGIYLPFNEQRFEKFKEGMIKLHQQVEAAGAKIVHLTPPVFDAVPIKHRVAPADKVSADRPYAEYDKVLERYSAWLLEMRDKGWRVIDLHAPLAEVLEWNRSGNTTFAFAADGVHLNQEGQTALGNILVGGLQAPFASLPLQFGDVNTPGSLHAKVFNLVHQRQRILTDAWLTDIGHKRPMTAGLPLNEAQAKGGELEVRIRELTK
jgi:lysophospholipase L1-like esterase